MKVLRKSCPRCQGDLSRVEDIGDTYYSCVQCGHVVYDVTAFRPALLRTPILAVPVVEPSRRAA